MYNEQEAYLQNVQATYRYYCFHVHNDGRESKDWLWIPSKFHMFLCDKVQEFVEKKTDKAYEILILNTPPQHGKLIADNEPVLTRSGWKNHGDLVVGDEVISPSGKFVKVTAVLPKQYANRLVTFTNGEQIKVHENHEWVVYDRSIHKETIRETKYIEKRVSYGKQSKERGHRYNFMLPLVKPLDCEEKSLAVEPYVLGVWLGDGKNASGQICAAERDQITLDEVRKHYPDGTEWVHKDTGVLYASYRGLYKDLQVYGMCRSRKRTEKHIPQEYLTASKRQRLELLAGLVDTDGYVDRKHNRIVFTTADKELRFSFEELIATFGWRTTTCECKPVTSSSGITGKRIYWQIAFNPTEYIPCRIERKKLNTFSKQRRIAICGVEEIAEERGNCITVEGGIYCVGRKLVPTHNSTTVTATFPSWYIMRNPDKKVIAVSYGDDLAQRFGNQNLEKVRTYGKIFGVDLNKKKANAKEFRIKGRTGVMISAGYGSGLTGNPADLIVIDDPVKNRLEADSETDRNRKWSDYIDSIESRISAGGKIILIMTRWHEDDLAGRLMEHYADRTTVINLPCEAEEDDVLGRKVGDALCPEIGKDNKWLADFKAAHMSEEGVRSWNALYQGRPTAKEGNILKREWWQYYEVSEYEKGDLVFDTMLMSVDAAFKDEKQNDYVAIGVWGKRGNRIYLVDCVNEHLNFMATMRKIRVLKARHPKVGATLIEDKANGTAIIQVLRNEIMGVIPVTPDASKEARVNAVSLYIEAGNVYLPKDKKFTWEFIDQCASFPNGKHDDLVDMMSQALSRLIFSKTLRKLQREAKRGDRYFTLPSSNKSNGVGKGDRIHVI